jgi:phage terminase large subunit-like protein
VLDNGEPWVLEDFQEWFIEDLFLGIKENWFILPEGNGKTTLIAGVAVYHIEHKLSAWAPIGAASRDQAEIAYRQAAGFVERSPSLKGRFRCLDGYRRITFENADGVEAKIQIFAADERTGDGVIPTLCIVDEPHRQRNMGLYRTWSGKLQKRHGQIVAISTAGEPGSEFEEARERIRQTSAVVTRTETFLRARSKSLVIHEWAVPEKGNVEDLELVKRANPFSGITVESLKEKRESPTMTFEQWRRYTCNLATRGEKAAITEAEWHGAAVEDRIPEGIPIWVGLDVAWKWDTTAIVPLWVRDPHFRLFGLSRILVPPRDGNSLDPYLIQRALADIHSVNPIHTVVMDITRAEELASWIQAELGATVIERGQGNQFAAMDYERFMEALRNDWLKHSGDPELTRHVLNAIARVLPDGRAKFERVSQTRQGGNQNLRVIDGLTAAAMVHTTATAEVAEPLVWTMA